MIEFEVPGNPVPQGRPRAVRVGKGVRMYDPEKSREYKRVVGLCARQAMASPPLSGPVKVTITVHLPIPKSMPKYKRRLIGTGQIRPVKRPDIDNFTKGVFDGCNGIVWEDDSQIVTLSVAKYYSENPRVTVRASEVEI